MSILKQELNSTQEPNGFKNQTVLVIEDDRLTQLYYGSILENLNLRPIACLTYEKALEELSAQKFDLVLCDVKLKDGNGIDLLRHYTKMNQTKVPFVISSGFTESELVELYGEFKASAVLIKPIGVQELMRVITALLNEQKTST